MTYAEAIDFLLGMRRFGLRPGLDTTERLAAQAGHPERGLRFIHVAGTNGKGSTCAFLESLYRGHGLRVGLYTSPHLVSFRERIQVNREPIPEPDVVRLLARLRGFLVGLPEDEHPTFFELVTVLALLWFQESACDLVIWETGLGGRLDATNIVTPLASVITNIGWDHTEWLGPTLEAIAAEKAGIIKPGVPVATATADPGAWAVLERTARERGSPMHRVTADDPEARFAAAAGLPLAGRHQVLNAALAVAMARRLAPILPVTDDGLRRGLHGTRWPGRFDVVRRPAGGTLVLDGAHNRPAFEVLAAALREEFPGRPYALVLGMLGDKDQRAAMEWVVPGASRVIVVPVHTSRGGDPAVLEELCGSVLGAERVTRAAGVGAALDGLAGEALVVLTGSLYLVGEALEWLGGGTNSERGLNDWGRRA